MGHSSLIWVCDVTVWVSRDQTSQLHIKRKGLCFIAVKAGRMATSAAHFLAKLMGTHPGVSCEIQLISPVQFLPLIPLNQWHPHQWEFCIVAFQNKNFMHLPKTPKCGSKDRLGPMLPPRGYRYSGGPCCWCKRWRKSTVTLAGFFKNLTRQRYK